tara:strand:- start:1325 stop:2755 length:1431 start_codon:yes stop_codon:yes gene_type:complete
MLEIFELVKKKSFTIQLFLLAIFIGIVLRIYNLNFEDYWFDEQTSFWVADPILSFSETIERSKKIDYGTHIVFNLILKKFFLFFNYDPQIGRIISLFFGILSIPAISYLTFQIQKGRSYVLIAFLCSINFYLISYSQELRMYSLIFFLSTLSIIFYFKIFEDEVSSNKKYIFAALYFFTSLIGTCVHIFFFIIIFSQFVYLILNYYFNKKNIIFSVICISIIPVFYLIIMFDFLLLQLTIDDDFWIQQVKIDFFINFFFSRFFGSKIMGLIYLLVLLYLIFYHRKKVFNISNKYFLLILIIFFSYFLPIFYSFLKNPILTDRYIIFVLIPIFIIISNLTLVINENKKKYFILFIIIFSSLINNYIEIFNRKISKPEFNKALDYISKSDVKDVLIKSNVPLIEKITINYSKNTLAAKNSNIIFYSSNQNYSNLSKVWLLCYEPINGFDCSPKNYLFVSWNENDIAKHHLIKSTLYKK